MEIWDSHLAAPSLCQAPEQEHIPGKGIPFSLGCNFIPFCPCPHVISSLLTLSPCHLSPFYPSPCHLSPFTSVPIPFIHFYPCPHVVYPLYPCPIHFCPCPHVIYPLLPLSPTSSCTGGMRFPHSPLPASLPQTQTQHLSCFLGFRSLPTPGNTTGGPGLCPHTEATNSARPRCPCHALGATPDGWQRSGSHQGFISLVCADEAAPD